jgi:hypothetical protein
VDGNHHEIVAALEARHCRVQRLAEGGGVPDLLVSRGGAMWLLEVKRPGESVNSLQAHWHQRWDAPVYTVRTPADVASVIG